MKISIASTSSMASASDIKAITHHYHLAGASSDEEAPRLPTRNNRTPYWLSLPVS
jgi:hypothetical protein